MNTEHHTASSMGAKVSTSILIKILVVLLILALTFWAGMIVGYSKADSAYRFSSSYFQNFGRPNIGFMNHGMMGGFFDADDLATGHGAAGTVVSVNLPNIIVSDRDGTEKQIVITDSTIVRSGRQTVDVNTIKTGDNILVIGTPTQSGSISAQLVRVMTFQSPMITGSATPGFRQGRGGFFQAPR